MANNCDCKSCENARTAPNWRVDPHTYLSNGWWVCYDEFARLRAAFRSEFEAHGYVARMGGGSGKKRHRRRPR